MTRLWVTRCLDCPLWVGSDFDDDDDRFCEHPAASAEQRVLVLDAVLRQGRYTFPRWCPLQRDSVKLIVPTQLRHNFKVAERKKRLEENNHAKKTHEAITS